MPVLDAIEKGIAKARDLGELSRLNGEAAMRERHRRECFTALGEKYYDAHKHGYIPECAVLYEELDAIDREMELLQREMQKVRKVTVCPGCGAKLTSYGVFCPFCGAERVKKSVCPECGAALDPDARYCVNCGKQTADPGNGRG